MEYGQFQNNGRMTLSKYLRRLVHYPQMDFRYTRDQMIYLLTKPDKIYKLAEMRFHTKGQWARDDPAFVVVLSAGICT